MHSRSLMALVMLGLTTGVIKFPQTQTAFIKADLCSETPNMKPHPLFMDDTHWYTADNTRGGLPNAPIRALLPMDDGILVGLSSPNPPDSINPKGSVRLLSQYGWEDCNGQIPVQGSVNALFQNPFTSEIFVVKDTEDPRRRPGQVVSIFDDQKWTHFESLPGVLDYRGYAAMGQGTSTWVATYDGIAEWRDKSWQRPSQISNFHDPVHALVSTYGRRLIDERITDASIWLGLLNKGIRNDQVVPDIIHQVGIPQNVRTMALNPAGFQLWVGGDPGLGYFDRYNNNQWVQVMLPDNAQRVLGIAFNPRMGWPCVATLDKGTYCFNGTIFKNVTHEPSMSVAFGTPNSFFDKKLFIGTQNSGLLQMPVPV